MIANVSVGGDQAMRKVYFFQGASAGQLALFVRQQTG
jgi:hypothetical protein